MRITWHELGLKGFEPRSCPVAAVFCCSQHVGWMRSGGSFSLRASTPGRRPSCMPPAFPFSFSLDSSAALFGFGTGAENARIRRVAATKGLVSRLARGAARKRAIILACIKFSPPVSSFSFRVFKENVSFVVMCERTFACRLIDTLKLKLSRL